MTDQFIYNERRTAFSRWYKRNAGRLKLDTLPRQEIARRAFFAGAEHEAKSAEPVSVGGID